jgi:hypothetical protein
MLNLPANWNTPDGEPTIVKEILRKFLSNGACAKVALVRHKGEYKAMLYIEDRRVNGPSVPQPLDVPMDGITHFMGNKPAVGLTSVETDTILWEVNEWIQRTGESK